MKRFVASLMIGLLLAGGAGAQTISRIISNTGLSPEDFSLMNQAAQSLYDVPAPRVGSEASWKNPDTQSHGTVRLTRMQQSCASLQHMAHPKGAAAARDIRLRWCKTADGAWVLQP